MPEEISPYAGLPPERFWKSGVAEQSPLAYAGLYRKRFAIGRKTRVATAGSCFAQHIARYLRAGGFSVLDVEPPPRGLPEERARAYGFSLYSARYGNIYLPRQLLQLAREAEGRFAPQAAIWEKDGRYYDALRPSVEPGGLASAAEVVALRQDHLRQVAMLLRAAEVFVFTFGLTEGWVHRASGTVYPTAPGTIAGRYDPEIFAFKNFTFEEVLGDFRDFRELVRAINPRVRFLLTVSPVPLTATASDQHVLPATMYSKSVLRAVAGQLYQEHEDIDYFPAYEIVAGHPSRGFFYDANLRTVAEAGVETVMRVFFAEHAATGAAQQEAAVDGAPRQARRRPGAAARARRAEARREREVCEEALLEAFAE